MAFAEANKYLKVPPFLCRQVEKESSRVAYYFSSDRGVCARGKDHWWKEAAFNSGFLLCSFPRS